MPYLITFHLLKSVDDWDEERGASGNSRDTDFKEKSFQAETRPGKTNLQEFLDSTDFYPLSTNDFVYWPDEPGRFTTNRIENDEGEPDPRGRYLVDYDVRIECHTIKPVRVGTLGLKSY